MTTILESVRAFMAEEFKGGAANISDLISACQEAESRKDLASIVEDINNQKLKEDATTLLQNGFDEGIEPELISLKLVKLLEEHEGSRNDVNLTDINQQREARSKKLESYERNLLGEYYDSGWQEVDSKQVKDWDDFWTDYTWYADADGHHVFIFGDRDIYGPEDTPDHEVDGDYAEAEEWFLSYDSAYGDADDYEECFSLGKVAEALAWEDDDDDDDDDWGSPRLSSSDTAEVGKWNTQRYKNRDLDESANKTIIVPITGKVENICAELGYDIVDLPTTDRSLEKDMGYDHYNKIPADTNCIVVDAKGWPELVNALKDFNVLDEALAPKDNPNIQNGFVTKPYWYFTKHGVQPGSVPKGVEIEEIKDTEHGTYFSTYYLLTTQELKDFDIKEERPQLEESIVQKVAARMSGGEREYVSYMEDSSNPSGGWYNVKKISKEEFDDFNGKYGLGGRLCNESIDPTGDNLSERQGVTSNKTYRFAGYNRNCSPVYAEYETQFSIPKGIIKDNEFTGNYRDEEGNYYQYTGGNFYSLICQNIEEALNESAFKDMYDNVYVEFRDGNPTFAYETLGDASYGMSMSKSGDIEHDLGSHEYTIMKLKDGVYYPVKGYEPVTRINEAASGKVYTVYAKNDDMTFIMHDEGNRLSVTGWYFGEPDAEATQTYDGNLVAEFPDDNSYNEALKESKAPTKDEIAKASKEARKQYGAVKYKSYSGDKLYFANENGDEVSVARHLNEEAEKLVNKNNGLEYTHRSDTFNGAEYDSYSLGYISRVKCGATIYYKHARGTNGYKYYVKQYHPYDDAEYSWAFSNDGKDWSIVQNRKVIDHISTQLEDFKAVAEHIVDRDKDVKSKMIHN